MHVGTYEYTNYIEVLYYRFPDGITTFEEQLRQVWLLAFGYLKR